MVCRQSIRNLVLALAIYLDRYVSTSLGPVRAVQSNPAKSAWILVRNDWTGEAQSRIFCHCASGSGFSRSFDRKQACYSLCSAPKISGHVQYIRMCVHGTRATRGLGSSAHGHLPHTGESKGKRPSAPPWAPVCEPRTRTAQACAAVPGRRASMAAVELAHGQARLPRGRRRQCPMPDGRWGVASRRLVSVRGQRAPRGLVTPPSTQPSNP